ncbi:MAG: alpha/beta fold hydrolase, partial [Chthoniobacterales bacterium]
MTEATWTAPDGAQFGYQKWNPASPPQAIVIAMHGLGCRAADFAPLGEKLCESGIALAAWNLRGQGLDPIVARRGAWLDLDGVLDDLRAFESIECAPNIPVFLCGESMGALLALQAAVRDHWKNRASGLILLSPVVALAQKNPPWLKALLHQVARVLPNLRLRPGWFIHGSRAMPKLTRVEERQHYLATAPHRLGPLTLNFLANMGDLIENAAAAAGKLHVPVAVFSGGDDVFTSPSLFRVFFAATAA